MERTTKKNILIIAIIVLVIINISALATIFYNKRVAPIEKEEVKLQRERIQQSGMYGYFKEALNLNDDQFVDFKNINQEYFYKTQEIGSLLNDSRHQLLIELSEENIDKNKIDSIARNIGTLHYELKLLTSEHFIELKNICNYDQQVMLEKMFFRMISIQDNDRPRHGRNQGKRRNNNRRNRR